MKPKLVYIAHPVATDEKFTTEQNVQDILRIVKNINNGDRPVFPPFEGKIVPCVPYLSDVLAMNDSISQERKIGIDNGMAVINTGMFDELWLTGHKLSLGMQEEVNLFKLQGKPIINLIEKI